ncbi:MAG TPA: putative metal-binding motif-containing protein [Candidatus Polarisedimenticolaceae bacterium]|nr:putative metal-binding motif-containing protein [Candidatus Polarisedimenticolaceae bacterium]
MKRNILLAAALLLAAERAQATCANGFTIELSGQLPDITFTEGVPQTIHFNPWYVTFNSTSYSCGIFARSNTPGVSLQDTYGCPGSGCPLRPPGEWAPVGDAYPTSTTSVEHKGTDITIVFNGNAPAGTQGTIQIAIRDNDSGIDSQAVIGTLNVYVVAPPPATAPLTWFPFTTAAGNVSGNRAVLDHPYLNGNPSARLFLSHVRNPGGLFTGTVWNHPIAVDYDAGLQRWTIVNVDGTAMPAGLGFGVRYDLTALRFCTGASSAAFLAVPNPRSDNDIWATVMVTPIGGAAHPIAVQYVAPSWRIVYSDNASIPANTCFNVKPFFFTQYMGDPASGDLSGRTNVTANWGVGVDTSGFGTGHNSGSARVLMFDWALENPFRQMVTTYNLTPRGVAPYYDPRYFGFSAPDPIAIGSRWAIYHEDGSTMPLSARFNAWAACAGPIWYPDGDGDSFGNSGGTVQASCSPLPGHATRGGDCNDASAVTYPGAAERNDGLDNNCSGDLGFGLVDEISGLTSFPDKTTFCWPAQAGAAEYQVARDGKRTFTACTILATTSQTCITDAGNPDPGGRLFYYLVRSSRHHVGSWGAVSSGAERRLSCP